MSLRNKLPAEYESILSSIINGDARYNDVIKPIFIALNPSHVTSISHSMRNALGPLEWQRTKRWWKKPRTRQESIMAIIRARPENAPLFSMSGNGYIREETVKKWIQVDSPFELALLLVRLNDWVPQVRNAAISKFEKLIHLPIAKSGLTKETVMGCMELILDPKRFGRSREIEFRILNQLLNMNGMPLALEDYITNSPTDNASRYLKLSLKRGILADALPSMVTQAKHSDVRRVATNTLLNGGYVWRENGTLQQKPINLNTDRTGIAKSALKDKSPAVQCIALRYIAEFKSETLYNEDTFRSFVNHKRFSIKERAIFGLKTLGIDYVEELRQKLKNGACSIHAIEILGRVGSAADGDLIFSQIDNVVDENKIRALGAAATLGNIPSMNTLELIAFDTHENRRARAASHKLCASAYYPNLGAIIRSIQEGQDIVMRGHVRLIQKLPTMKFALVLSELTKAGIELDYSNLWPLLSKKRNTGAFLPSIEEIDALKKSVGKSDPLKTQFYKTLGLSL